MDFTEPPDSYFRNDKLDAQGWTPTLGNQKPRPPFNQFGANIGVPIATTEHSFANYEGERAVQGITYQATAPTADLQAGDFPMCRRNYLPRFGSFLLIL
jgi:hypothetical protein